MFDFIGDTWDWVCDNPGKVTTILAVGAVTGGLGFIYAGTIASTAGSLSLLATTATTGVEIASLGGAALQSASLAALGGGAVSVGGGGMAAGAIVVSQACAVAGAGMATAVVTQIDSSDTEKTTGIVTSTAAECAANIIMFRKL